MYSLRLAVNFLKYGFQFMIARPFMQLLLTMYSICNLHDISWGTKGLNIGLDRSHVNAGHTSRISIEFKYFKLWAVLIWLITNISFCVLYFSSLQGKGAKFVSAILYLFALYIFFKLIAGLVFGIKFRYQRLGS
jgi:hypothetical protein